MLHRYFARSRKKCCAADIIDKYKTTHVYKKIKKEHSLKIVKIIQMKQKEIEDDENILLIKSKNNENNNTLSINRYTNIHFRNQKNKYNNSKLKKIEVQLISTQYYIKMIQRIAL